MIFLRDQTRAGVMRWRKMKLPNRMLYALQVNLEGDAMLYALGFAGP